MTAAYTFDGTNFRGFTILGKINAAVKTVETVTEMVEEVAEEVEKVAEEVEEKLPQESKLKEALESVDNLAKKVVKESNQAEELVHKVTELFPDRKVAIHINLCRTRDSILFVIIY